jgi:hypothetical protein
LQGPQRVCNNADDLDLVLSVVSLSATLLAVTTGGSSLTLKAGAGFLRVAHLTGNIPGVVARFVRRVTLDVNRYGTRTSSNIQLSLWHKAVFHVAPFHFARVLISSFAALKIGVSKTSALKTT